MTIVKHETIELAREEFTVINKCIKLMVTAKKAQEILSLKKRLIKSSSPLKSSAVTLLSQPRQRRKKMLK